MNDTQQLIHDMALKICRDSMACDPEHQEYVRQYDDAWAAFTDRHPKELRTEVLRLLDLSAGPRSLTGQRMFFLGLQLGLDLRDLNLLEDFSLPALLGGG